MYPPDSYEPRSLDFESNSGTFRLSPDALGLACSEVFGQGATEDEPRIPGATAASVPLTLMGAFVREHPIAPTRVHGPRNLKITEINDILIQLIRPVQNNEHIGWRGKFTERLFSIFKMFHRRDLEQFYYLQKKQHFKSKNPNRLKISMRLHELDCWRTTEMKNTTTRLAACGALFSVYWLASCGSLQESNDLSLDNNTSSNDVGKGEQIAGHSETDPALGLTSSARGFEHWELIDNKGNIFLYQPSNYHVAMSAFRRAIFSNSGQTCSGTLMHERNAATRNYDVYYMTALHCLYKTNVFGERVNATMGQVTLQAFEGQYAPGSAATFTNNDYIKGNSLQYLFLGGNSYRRSITKQYPDETLNKSPQIYSSSDVVRIPYRQNVSEVDARKISMPLCGVVEKPADKVFGTGSTPIRLMLGNTRQAMGGYTDRLILERMNGRHNIKGTVRGEYKDSTSLAALNDFVFKSVVFGNGVTFYGYKSLLGGGAEATDSGAPIIYGTQEPLSANIRNLFLSQETAGLAENWQVKSLDCISGVISRQLSRHFGYYNNANSMPFSFKYEYPWLTGDLKNLGSETITIIQEVSSNGVWRSL